MLTRLFRDSLAYALGSGLSGVVGLLLLPVYTAYLAPSALGLFDIANVVISIASLVVALEVSQGAARYYCDEPDLSARRQYFSTAFGFTLATFAGFGLLAGLVAPYAAKPILGPNAAAATVVLVVAAATCLSIFRLSLAQLRWMLRPRAFLACSMLQLAVNTAVSLWLVVACHAGAHGLLWGLIAGSVTGGAAALFAGRVGLTLAWSREPLKRMLRFSVPLVMSSAAVWLAMYVDRLAIKSLMTMADVGVYGVAYRFASAVDILMFGFDQALMPLIYTHHRDPDTPAALSKLSRMLTLGGTAILLGLAVAARDLVHFFATPDYGAAAALIPVLAFSVLLARFGSLAPGLWVANRTVAIGSINAAAAIANLGLNLLLIPKLGVMGAALATATSSLLGFGFSLVASQKHYPVPHAWLRLAGALCVLALALSALQLIGSHSAANAFADLGVKTLTATTALALCCAILLSRDEWLALRALTRRLAHRSP